MCACVCVCMCVCVCCVFMLIVVSRRKWFVKYFIIIDYFKDRRSAGMFAECTKGTVPNQEESRHSCYLLLLYI